MRNSWVDFKLGARMLLKHPGLTLIGGLALAVGIAVSTGFFVFLYSFIYPTLPLDEGDRIVGIVNWDPAISNSEPRSLHDFVTWRDQAESFDEIGAFRPIERNLITDGGATLTISGVEITAAGLRLAHVPPLLGRLLIDEDERKGSADVALIDYEISAHAIFLGSIRRGTDRPARPGGPHGHRRHAGGFRVPDEPTHLGPLPC